MIVKYEIRTRKDGRYTTSVSRLYSATTAGKMVLSLMDDWMFEEAIQYARPTPFWALEESVVAHTAFFALPQQARKRVKPHMRKAIDRGKTVTILACIY